MGSLSIDIFDFANEHEREQQAEIVENFEAIVKEMRSILDSSSEIIFHVPTSNGKDSSLVTLACLEAYRQSIQVGAVESSRPLILSTVDTLAESLPMIMYVHYCKKRIEDYASKHGINLYYDIVTPPLNDEYFVKYCGGQKLVPNPTRRGDCSIILKVTPSEKYVKQILSRFESSPAMSRYGNALVLSCVGSRLSEGARRSRNMKKQGISEKSASELLSELESVDVGGREIKKYAPIKNWSTEHVFTALSLAGEKPVAKPLSGVAGIPGYLPDFGLLLEIYGNGSKETCEISVGSKMSSGCNGKARFGCNICTMVATTDHSSTALTAYPRWRVLGAENVLRVRDFLFRLSCDMDARAFHARAYDPVCYNRVAMQPNVLKPKYLEKMVRYASQLSIESHRNANEFRKLVEQGREEEHPGYADILSDINIPPKTKRAYLEMYKECAQMPLINLFSEAHAILLSFRWSIDGIGAAPYRPLAIWHQLLAGKGWIPYPKLNSEWELKNGKIKLTNDDNPLPDAVMFPILKNENPHRFVENPVSLLELWQRPTDHSDIFDKELNCTLEKVANKSSDITLFFDFKYVVEQRTFPSYFNREFLAWDVVLKDTNIVKATLNGRVVSDSVIKHLSKSGVKDEISDYFYNTLEQLYRDIGTEFYLSESEELNPVIRDRVADFFSGIHKITRRLKYFEQINIDGGFSDVARKASPKIQFTKRVAVRGKGNRIVRKNTRLNFYRFDPNSSLYEAHVQNQQVYRLNFGVHSRKYVSVHDESVFNSAIDAVENIELSPLGISEWKLTGGLEEALREHDEYFANIIKKRHIRGYRARKLRGYGGTHVAESLLSTGGVTIARGYWQQLIAILKRTHVFNDMGLFSFQSFSYDELANHPSAITMSQHRNDKAKIVRLIRNRRAKQREDVRNALRLYNEGRYSDEVLLSLALNINTFVKSVEDAINLVSADYYPAMFHAKFDTSEVSPAEKANAAMLLLKLFFSKLSDADDLLELITSRRQLQVLKSDSAKHLDATKLLSTSLQRLDINTVTQWSSIILDVKCFLSELGGAIENDSPSSDWHLRFRKIVTNGVSDVDSYFLNGWRPNKRYMFEYLTRICAFYDESLTLLESAFDKVCRFDGNVRRRINKMNFAQRIKVSNRQNMDRDVLNQKRSKLNAMTFEQRLNAMTNRTQD